MKKKITYNFPKQYIIPTKTAANKTYLFDIIRKKWVVAQPEEWVRQHFIHFLLEDRHFPKGRIAVEKLLIVHNLRRRTDIVVYNKKGQAIFLVECKSPTVKISQKTFEQISRYNIALKVPYLVVTNGLQHFSCCINFENSTYSYLEDIPFYQRLL